MNWNLLTILFVAILLLGPVVFLLLRFLKGRRFPWLFAILLPLVLGWGSALGASWSSTQNLAAQIREYEARGEEIPDRLMEASVNDASAVFALMFGWAFAIPILCLGLIAYAIAHGIRVAIRRRAPAPLPSPSSSE